MCISVWRGMSKGHWQPVLSPTELQARQAFSLVLSFKILDYILFLLKFLLTFCARERLFEQGDFVYPSSVNCEAGLRFAHLFTHLTFKL